MLVISEKEQDGKAATYRGNECSSASCGVCREWSVHEWSHQRTVAAEVHEQEQSHRHAERDDNLAEDQQVGQGNSEHQCQDGGRHCHESPYLERYPPLRES